MPAPPKGLLYKIATVKPPRTGPLWLGPEADGWLGGVTQSMIASWLVCRERFRVKYVLGLQQARTWNHRTGYGDAWHVCEEAFSANKSWEDALTAYAGNLMEKWPFDRENVSKWIGVLSVQFPEYVKYWSEHPDTVARTPLMQEQVFDVPYKLPSGRTIRLRGKFDQVDLLAAHVDNGAQYSEGVWLGEHKTKGDIDQRQLEKQLTRDLQTMMYLTALEIDRNAGRSFTYPILGVRYNVIRRPLSGGKGSITPHKEKRTKDKVYKTKPTVKGTYVPAETMEHFLCRLRDDYIAAEPHEWFYRWKVPVSANDIKRFRTETLDPILEQMCSWYDEVVGRPRGVINPLLNFTMPYGIYSSLLDGGETETDHYLQDGSVVGLREVDTLFEELK